MKLASILLIFMNLLSCTGEQMPQKVSQKEDQLMKSFSVIDSEKHEYSFHLPNEKKLTVLFYFATWCPDCHKEIPYLKQVVEKFKSNDAVQFMGIRTFTHKDKENDLQRFMSKFEPNFPIYTDPKSEEFPKGRLVADHAITWVPTVKLVTSQGEVFKVKAYSEYQTYIEDLEKFIKEKL